MAIATVGGRRALVGGLLVLVLLVTGAMPAAAGGSGPGSGSKGKPAGAQGGGGHKSTVSAKQVSSASKPSARKSQGSSPRPARHSAAGPQVAKAPAAKPSAAPNKPKPAEHKPEQKDEAPERDQKPDQPKQRSEDSKPSAHRPRTEVRSATVFALRQPVSRVERPRPVRVVDRPVAAVVTSAADPSTALFTPPPVVEIQAAAVELEPRRFWPRLPGAAGHPAFPGLLAAVLLGFIALGFRGDRRDPKLAAAAIDDRDDRAEFR